MSSKDLFKGLALHALCIPAWVLAPAVNLYAAAALASSRTRKLAVGIWVVTLAALVSKPGPSDRFVKLMYWLGPASLARYFGGDHQLRGHLEEMNQGPTVYCFHPHGVLAGGFSFNGCWSEDFHTRAPGTVFLISSVLRQWNFAFKLLCDLSGRLESISVENIRGIMGAGQPLAIIPGGFADAAVQKFGEQRVVMDMPLMSILVKNGLQHGYRLLPVYTFGESETFRTVEGLYDQRLELAAKNIPGVVFFGWPACPIFPRPQASLLTYVGRAVQLPTIAKPTPEEVAHWKHVYQTALWATFEEFKADAGYPDATLVECPVATRRSKL